MNILITGSEGLLGYSLVQKLKNYHTLFCLVRSKNKINSENIKYIFCDLTKNLDIESLPKKIDVIIHMAQSSFFKEFPNCAENIYQVNCTATANLLNYALKVEVKQFIFTSSGSVYEPYNNQIVENITTNPSSFYANSKLIAERLILPYQHFFKICILRLFFLYGPYHCSKNFLINSLIDKIRLKETITIEDNGGLNLVPTLTNDVSSAIGLVIDKEIHGIFNLASDKPMSIKRIIQIISSHLKIEANIKIDKDKQPLSIVPDLSKIKLSLPELKFTSFSEGVKLIV